MRSGMYPKLALQNIGKNRRFYFPYLLTGLLTVAMFYNMLFISTSKDISKMPGANSLKFLLALGSIVVGLFAFIFLIYTNSFLIKRRHKELGLYNILGMEKRHIARILSWEMLFTCLITIPAGLLFGILLSKLLMLLLFRMLFFEVHFGFSVEPSAIIITCILFSAIYMVALIGNLVKVRLSNPIELIREGRSGEREPKTKWLITVIGILTLGGGYTIALTTESPLEALLLFFIAVILVIIGTYSLFTAGSIALLKLLRKNRNFYYKAGHFISVSGMMYRMKRNAAGLANICILSTMVLVMISTTVCMYIGVEDALVYRFPNDISFSVALDHPVTPEEVRNILLEEVERSALAPELIYDYTSLSFSVDANVSVLEANEVNYSYKSEYVTVLTAEEYKKLTGSDIGPEKGQVMAVSLVRPYSWDSVTILGNKYSIAQWLDDFPFDGGYYNAYVNDAFVFIVPDKQDLEAICAAQIDAYGDHASSYVWSIGIDLDGSDEDIRSCYASMLSALSKNRPYSYSYTDSSGAELTAEYHVSQSLCRQAAADEFYSLYGGLLFLGLFLGALFLMATVLIIYYKQISEGYEDKERYEIMQKIGMSRDEVKTSIRSQILTVFFLPLAGAIVHLAAAFKMITKLMLVLNLSNIVLFAVCTLGTIIVFAVVYAVVYSLTARTYYKIVG
ncbi:MAG: ABC transporter permease [Clostridiales bacterium]|nr:ABC transporter permease [Clostridiales bacterium]